LSPLSDIRCVQQEARPAGSVLWHERCWIPGLYEAP
jgi:hypothetical protein